MKSKKMQWIALLGLLSGSVFAQVPVSYWTFDEDAAGLGIKNCIDSGSQATNTKWSADTVGQGQVTDGAGNFVISGNALNRYTQLTDLSGNEAAYNPAYTSGVYRLELNFASWELDTATAGKIFVAARSGATEIARIEFFLTGANAITVQWNNEGGEFRTRTFTWTNSAVSFATELDFDNDTARYYMDETQIGSDFVFTAAQMDNLQYSANGWNGSSNGLVEIDSMGLIDELADPPVPPPEYEFVPVSQWTFDDAAGTGLQNAIDSGSQADYTKWSADTVTQGQVTDGLGSFVINGDTVSRWSNLVDLTNGASAYNPAYTSGVFRFEVNFSSWAIGNATDGDVTYLVRNGEMDIAKIEFNVMGANSTRIQLSHEGTDFRSQTFTGTNGAVSVVMELDLDSDTARYFIDGVQFAVDFAFNAAQLDNLRYGVSSAWNGTGTDTLKIDSLGLFVETLVVEPPQTPTEAYNVWISAYSVGANSNLLDHGDSDELDNLTEYAWGGDPSDGGSLGNTPAQTVLSGATNVLEYIYFERTNAVALGLSSILEVGTDLVITNWADGGSYEVGRGDSGIAGFNAVTNWIPTDSEDKQFIHLQVQFTP